MNYAKRLMLDQGIQRRHILDAIDEFEERAVDTINRDVGLCAVFNRTLPIDYDGRSSYTRIPRVLNGLGGQLVGGGGYYWPTRTTNQRRMMLAFMLTWMEDKS